MKKPISTELYETTYLMMDKHDRDRVRKIVKEVEKMETMKCNRLQFSKAVKNFVERNGFSKEFVCGRFGIDLKSYNNFLNGSYNYTKRQEMIFDELEFNVINN